MCGIRIRIWLSGSVAWIGPTRSKEAYDVRFSRHGDFHVDGLGDTFLQGHREGTPNVQSGDRIPSHGMAIHRRIFVAWSLTRYSICFSLVPVSMQSLGVTALRFYLSGFVPREQRLQL